MNEMKKTICSDIYADINKIPFLLFVFHSWFSFFWFRLLWLLILLLCAYTFLNVIIVMHKILCLFYFPFVAFTSPRLARYVKLRGFVEIVPGFCSGAPKEKWGYKSQENKSKGEEEEEDEKENAHGVRQN